MSLRGLTIVIATADRERYHSALTTACAHAALGAPTRLFFDSAAVPLLAGRNDELADTALDLGVLIIACQTGLAQANLPMTELDPRYAAGGMTSLIAALGDDRLVVV